MSRETDPVPPSSSPGGPSRSHPGPDFGAMLHSRRYTGTAYFFAAAFMFFPIQILALCAFITGPTQSVGFTVTAFAITVGMGAAAATPFVVWGRRNHGLIIEVYEHGMRFAKPPASDAVFLFTQVKELKKRTIRGALASLTFVLADGRAHKVGVSGRKDVAMLQDVMARFGPVRWEAARGFRIL